MEIDKGEFRKTCPNLAKEMNINEQRVTINSLRSNTKTAEKAVIVKKNLARYEPDIIDFIRRCNNKHQAEEIIVYMENRGEITHSYSQELRHQLRDKGVRSFGPKKEEGYYFKVSSK